MIWFKREEWNVWISFVVLFLIIHTWCAANHANSFIFSLLLRHYIHFPFLWWGSDVDSGAKVCATRWPKIWTTMKHGSLAADARLLGMPHSFSFYAHLFHASLPFLTVWLLSSWNVGYVAGRRHGVDWHARSVHLARHDVRRLRVGRLPTPWQDTLLRTANPGSFARRQI